VKVARVVIARHFGEPRHLVGVVGDAIVAHLISSSDDDFFFTRVMCFNNALLRNNLSYLFSVMPM
jgi:hypothetical protein